MQNYGLLSFSYPSATGTFQIVYVRVRKPDGSVVETPEENVQDMAAEITQFTKVQVLQQSGVAVLSQANQIGGNSAVAVIQQLTQIASPDHDLNVVHLDDDALQE